VDINFKPTPIDEIDVKKISLDIFRDIYAASRQLMMYPMGHPIMNETLKKPLESLNTIFSFKRSFIFQVHNQRLAAEGILLDDAVFIKGLLKDLAKHDITRVEFTAEITSGDLYTFLSKLLESKCLSGATIQEYLVEKDVASIKINQPGSSPLYNIDDNIIGLPKAKYMLSERVKDILNDNSNIIISYYIDEIIDDDDLAARLEINFRLPFLASYIKSIISHMPEKKALDLITQVIYSTNWLGESTDQKTLEGIRKLWKDYTVQKEDISIILPVYNIFKSVGATEDVIEFIFDKAALIKLKAVRQTEEIISHLRANRAREIDFQLLKSTVFKLATDMYSQPLEKLLKQLLDSLSSRVLDTRQRGLRLTIEATEILADGAFWDIYRNFIKEALRLALMPKSQNEIIELIVWIIEKSAKKEQWECLKIGVQTLKTIASDKVDYKSIQASNKLDELAESPILTDILTGAVLDSSSGSELFEAVSAIASRKVAAVLVEKIDCPNRNTRARVIKSLVRMGEQIGPEVIKKFAELVSAGETNDVNAWYKIRNMLRVLSEIKYFEAIPYFEVLAGWKQKRIKLDLISACEVMKSPTVSGVLSKLAVDIDRDVRKNAIIALGMSGYPDMVKQLRNLFTKTISDHELIIVAIGRIGGAFARDTLIELYENPDVFENLEISKKDEQNIKVALLKALSVIDDDVSRSKIELYSKSGKHKLFKKDVLSETALILLSNNKK